MKASVLKKLIRDIDPDTEIVFSVVDTETKEFVVQFDYVGLSPFIVKKEDFHGDKKYEYQFLNLMKNYDSPIIGHKEPINEIPQIEKSKTDSFFEAFSNFEKATNEAFIDARNRVKFSRN